MSLATILSISMVLSSIHAGSTNLLDLRNPTITGVVTLEPGTFDSNTCDPNGYNGRYDGAGFYVQDKKGNGVWVCPSSASLVSGIQYGDRVEISGKATTSEAEIFTIVADSVNLVPGRQKEKIKRKPTFDDFYQSNFGDLVKIKGFVTEILFSEVYGEAFVIEDCDGNTIKGWWTASISDAVGVAEVFKVSTDPDFVPSYFEMVGFAETYFPMCWTGTSSFEFQPRSVAEIVEITPPCDPPINMMFTTSMP